MLSGGSLTVHFLFHICALRHLRPRTPCGVRQAAGRGVWCRCNFNPRTPCGVRQAQACYTWSARKFQSTHPLRGATVIEVLPKPGRRFQSTHPLRGATFIAFFINFLCAISIHAPLAGCDNLSLQKIVGASVFQSTHPLRGATANKNKYESIKHSFLSCLHKFFNNQWQFYYNESCLEKPYKNFFARTAQRNAVHFCFAA